MATDNNRIEVEDIVAKKDILDALNEIKGGLEGLKNELANVAHGQKIELKNIISTSGMEKASERVNLLVQALASLNVAYQQNQGAIQAITQAQVRQAVADKAAAEAKKANAQAEKMLEQQSRQTQKAMEAERREEEAVENTHKLLIGTIKTEALSYNELYAVYKLMSAQLKDMSAEVINSSDANRKFAAITKNVRDAMNESMKAMGNYTLNVGKYHTAFDGLGYSIQQVLREVPSAINISQFFLAISNNIPMVVDQMKAFNQEQKNIKKQMEDLNEGSQEYIELQKQQMSVGQKMLKSIFSWQTALLAVLLVLRKYGEDLISWIGEAIRGFRAMDNVQKEMAKSDDVGKMVTKYKLLQEEWRRLSTEGDKTQFIKDQKDAFEDLGLSVNNVTDAERVLVSNADAVIESFRKRALAAAAYKLAQEEYEKALRKNAIADVDNWWNNLWDNARRRQAGKANSRGDAYMKIAVDNGYFEDTNKASATQKRAARKKEIELEEDMWEAYWMAIAKTSEAGEKRELAIRLANYDIAKKHQQEHYEELVANAIEYYKQKGKITIDREGKIVDKTGEFNSYIEELQMQHNEIMRSMEYEYQEDKFNIQTKYIRKRFDEQLKEEKADVKIASKRTKTVEDEKKANQIRMSNIELLYKELERIKSLDTKNDEENERKKQDAINKTTDAIERQMNAMKFDQQLKNYKNFWDMVGANGVLEGMGGSDKKGFLEKLGIVGVNDENAESVFDQWVTNASAALKDMSEELGSYLNDMLDKWASFYDGQAELAAKNTEAAKNYYDEQKRLQEDGYANEVETAWATYQERLKYQQQAEQMAKQWASVSQYVSDVESGANLAVAVSNLLKQFTSIPGVGIPLAVGAVATLMKMWGTYKAQIKSVATYGDGGYEALVGGSHASGHDIDMGFSNKSGRRVHTEGGEGWAVFSRRAVRRYGHRNIGNMVNAVNAGTLAVNALGDVERGVNVHVSEMNPLSMAKVERLLESIDKNGSSKTYVLNDGTMVVTNGNSTKRIRR